MSSDHYLRYFSYCDSGMIPWLLVVELVSKSDRSLGEWVHESFENFPSLGEIKFLFENLGSPSTVFCQLTAAIRCRLTRQTP